MLQRNSKTLGCHCQDTQDQTDEMGTKDVCTKGLKPTIEECNL